MAHILQFTLTVQCEEDECDEVREMLDKLLGIVQHTPFQVTSFKEVANEPEED